MKKNTPTKKEPIKAHRGTIVYRGGGGRPIGGGRPRPSPFGPPRGGRRRPRIDPRIMFGGPRRGLGGSSMAGQALSKTQRDQIAFSQRRDSRLKNINDRMRQRGRSQADIDRRLFDTSQKFERRGNRRFGNLNPEQQSQFAKRQKQQRDMFNLSRRGNKGMVVTKKAIGENDFRKGGLTLSTVNNLKKT